MDPHFPEYLAAIAGMHDLYGESGDDRPSDFHEVSATECGDVAGAPGPTPVALPHWDLECSEEFASSGAWI